MRVTIDLPNDLHRAARELARSGGRSMSEVIAELMRLGLERASWVTTGPRGLPQVTLGRSITADDVGALDDV